MGGVERRKQSAGHESRAAQSSNEEALKNETALSCSLR